MTLRSRARRLLDRHPHEGERGSPDEERARLDAYAAMLDQRAAELHLEGVRRERFDDMVDCGFLDALDETARRNVTTFVPGSFYSPVPDAADVESAHQRRKATGDPPPGGIDVDVERQFALLDELAPLVREFVDRVQAGEARRYRSANKAFDLTDAALLSGIIRRSRPRRIVEVGSGHSTAAIFDTYALAGSTDLPEITCIDPYPQLVEELLDPADLAEATILAQPVQDVDQAIFRDLSAGDILFLDTTHVVKPGSDVVHDLFHVLPLVAPGVWVHIHDIPWPFQTVSGWDTGGRLWFECYQVGSFLQYNDRFEVAIFVDQLTRTEPDRFSALVPCALEEPGGSLWLRVLER